MRTMPLLLVSVMTTVLTAAPARADDPITGPDQAAVGAAPAVGADARTLLGLDVGGVTAAPGWSMGLGLMTGQPARTAPAPMGVAETLKALGTQALAPAGVPAPPVVAPAARAVAAPMRRPVTTPQAVASPGGWPMNAPEAVMAPEAVTPVAVSTAPAVVVPAPLPAVTPVRPAASAGSGGAPARAELRAMAAEPVAAARELLTGHPPAPPDAATGGSPSGPAGPGKQPGDGEQVVVPDPSCAPEDRACFARWRAERDARERAEGVVVVPAGCVANAEAVGELARVVRYAEERAELGARQAAEASSLRRRDAWWRIKVTVAQARIRRALQPGTGGLLDDELEAMADWIRDTERSKRALAEADWLEERGLERKREARLARDWIRTRATELAAGSPGLPRRVQGSARACAARVAQVIRTSSGQPDQMPTRPRCGAAPGAA
jgi:hypothetical protein